MNIPEAQYTYRHQRPGIGTDLIYCSITPNGFAIAVIERGIEPFKGTYALPGGHVDPGPDGFGEQVHLACIREAKEEIGVDIHPDDLKFVGVFDKPHRDPRGWRVSLCYIYVQTNDVHPSLIAGDDAAAAKWIDLHDIPNTIFAFDHRDMVLQALATQFDNVNMTDIDAGKYVKEINAVVAKMLNPNNQSQRDKIAAFILDGGSIINSFGELRVSIDRPNAIASFQHSELSSPYSVLIDQICSMIDRVNDRSCHKG